VETAGIDIAGSGHQPAGAHRVPELVEDLCEYVNGNWRERSPIHLASYVMWKLNWIHPFTDGNGRTSRAASYLVLCLRTGYLLPGKKTIPDQIAEGRKPYYDALEAADKASADDRIDLSEMEAPLSSLLARQLVGVFDDATSVPSSPGIGIPEDALTESPKEAKDQRTHPNATETRSCPPNAHPDRIVPVLSYTGHLFSFPERRK
jgi:hypothetical protein